MNRKFNACFVLILALILVTPMASAQGTTAFNFQGQLKLDGELAGGDFDFEFSLYNGPDPLGDILLGIDIHLAVAVSDGIFMAMLDFGPGIFDGTPIWLRICVRETGSTQLFCLDPLQQITPVPYATFSVNASELDGIDSEGFLQRDSGCEICIGHADSNGPSPTEEQCFDLNSTGRIDSNRLQFEGNVDGNDRLWLWMQCP